MRMFLQRDQVRGLREVAESGLVRVVATRFGRGAVGVPGRSVVRVCGGTPVCGWHAGAVRIKGLVWLGVPTDRYEQTVGFFQHVLGMSVAFQEGTTVELAAQNGDKVQIFSPDHRYFEFFRGQRAPLVPLFEVDSLDGARAHMAGTGATIVGEEESDAGWTWIHLRGPDGNIYELAERRL